MYRDVLECIGIYSTVYEWSRDTTMQNLELLAQKMVLECKGMFWNVLECNVLECLGMYWNV